MTKYLLIQSRDPFDSGRAASDYELASSLAQKGHEVSMFLIQNGVLAARKSAHFNGLQKAAQSGVRMLADEFSLRERGIQGSHLAEGVQSAPLDRVVDQLAEGRTALWL